MELARNGARREISFGEVADRSSRLAGALAARGIAKGDVVITLVGNRPEWVYAMVASFRLGAVALPCTEQLRPADLQKRIELVEPRAAVADERNAASLEEAGFDGVLLQVPDERLFERDPAPAAELAAEDPAIVVFTSALSLTPRTRIQVTPRVIRSAGTLNQPAGPPGAGKGGNANCGGR